MEQSNTLNPKDLFKDALVTLGPYNSIDEAELNGMNYNDMYV
jgi:hypothetical protein